MSGNTMRLLPHDNELAWTPYVWLIYVVPFLLTPLYYSPYESARGWTMRHSASKRSSRCAPATASSV